MKKIGFFGGTFNPIHIAHIRMALEVFESFKLDKLHFVPAPIPPHKKKLGLLDFSLRSNLIKLAFDEYNLNDIFSISDHENTMNGPSYTFDSVQLWTKLYSAKPYFIVGLEDFIQLHTWKKGLELPLHTNFIVVKRAAYIIDDFHTVMNSFWGKSFEKVADNKYSLLGSTIEYLETSRIDVSSTQIRNIMKEKRNVSGLLPESVRHYIQDNSMIIEAWNS